LRLRSEIGAKLVRAKVDFYAFDRRRNNLHDLGKTRQVFSHDVEEAERRPLDLEREDDVELV
jgi:hypothetical protein